MKRSKTMIKITIIFLVLLALALFLNWSNKLLVVTRYTFQSRQVPRGFDGFRIVQVSDLQSEYFGREQRNLLDAVRRSKPDIIVFTGDLVDRNHTDYEASLTAMEGLSQIAPVCYVNGNHELALPEKNISQMYDTMGGMGVSLLFNRVQLVERGGDRLYVIGLAEEVILSSKERGQETGKAFDESLIDDTLEPLLAQVKEEDMTVLLVHEPQLLAAYANRRTDLIFAGHAHGGQIRLPFTEGLFAPGQGVLPKLTSGVHREGNSSMVISRGLGNSVFPFRIFNQPEIVVVDLKRSV